MSCARLAVVATGLLALAAQTPTWAQGLPVVQAKAPVWERPLQPGDSLIRVHRSLVTHGLLIDGVTWQDLQRHNGWANPERLPRDATLLVPLAWLKSEVLSAELVHVHGNVQIESADGAPKPARVGLRLQSGDRVVTAEGATTSVRFADGTITLISPASRVRLMAHRRSVAGGQISTQIVLEGGGTEVRVPPGRAGAAGGPPGPGMAPNTRFEIETPKAKLGVRGTQFRSRLSEGDTAVEVLTGLVGANDVAVSAGMGTVASAQGVAVPVPLLPPPDLTAMAMPVESLPMALRLGAVAGAARYRVGVYAGAGSDVLLAEALVSQRESVWPTTLPDGRYELRARAVDARGLQGMEARSALTISARPEPPLPVQPRAGHRQYSPGIELRWARQPEASQYRLQIAQAPAGHQETPRAALFGQALIDRPDLTETRWQEQLPVGRYAWRVASVTALGQVGPFGDPRWFEVAAVPAAGPPAAPKLSDAGIELSWPALALPGFRQELQVARDAQFTQIVVAETLEGTQWLLSEPQPGLYHVRLRPVAPDGWRGEFGATQTIEVPSRPWWLMLSPLLLLL